MKRNYQVKRNPRPKTKVRKRGRPPLDNRPMTSAERLRRLVTDLLLEKVKVEAAPWPGKRKSMKRNYQMTPNPRPKTKVRKRGRPLLGNRPMPSAERVRKHRALNALLNAD
jgi:hypothetical protein